MREGAAPTGVIVGTLVFRAVVVWLAVRAGFAAIEFVNGVPPLAMGVIGVCAALGIVDAARHRKHALWGKLGIDRRTFPVVAAGVATVGELALFLVTRA
jgi:hypothetical protein